MTDTFNENDPILIKVQKLVDKAWSTQFPEERDALLAKADALMLKYSIDQFMLLDPNRPRTAAPIVGQDPEMREIWYFGQGTTAYSVIDDRDVIGSLHQIFYRLATHVGCRIGVFGWDRSKVVGYPADLDFLELMFLSLKLHLIEKMYPHIAKDLAWEVNLIAFKQAGYKWEEIHKKMHVLDDYPYRNQAWQRNMGVRFTAVYKRYRDAHPDEPQNLGSPKLWRRSFVQGYEYEIGNRLWEMREASAKTIDNLPALLKSKDKSLDDLFNELWPPVEYKEEPYTGKIRKYKEPKPQAYSHQAASAGRSAARTADLNQRGARVGGSTDRAIGS